MLRLFAGWLGHPWVVLGAAVALIGSLVWAYGAGKQNGVDQERAAQTTAVAIAVSQAKAAHEAQLRDRGWQDAREAAASREARATLQERLAELAAMPPKVLIKTKVVRDENGCDCPVPSIGDDFWLRFKSAGSQHRPTDPAAANPVPDRM